MDQKRFWVLLSRKFSGEATAADSRELDQLLASEPEWRARYEAMSRYWHRKDQHPAVNAEAVFRKTLGKIKSQAAVAADAPGATVVEIGSRERRNPGLVAWLVRLAAVAVLGLTGFLVYQGYHPKPLLASFFLLEKQNPKGTQSKIILSDGSTVWLNGGSKLQFPADFGEGESREVYLSGEAFFEVTTNPRKPFIIYLKNSRIKVLGTSFNVRAFADEVIETSVVSGKVAFMPQRGLFSKTDKDTLLLTPNVKALYSGKTGQVRQEQTNSQIDKAWTEGKLIFRATPFGEIGKALERTYGKRVRFTNPDLKHCRLTASFENTSLEEVMYLLSRTRDYRYTIDDREVVIAGRGCSPSALKQNNP
jgi:transmembrane sensor